MQLWRKDESIRYHKAVIIDEAKHTERMVGVMVYHDYSQSTAVTLRDPWPKTADEIPTGANTDLCLHYFEMLTTRRLLFMAGKPHFFLADLAVDPGFQGEGMGKKMLEFMVAELDQLRL